jgi:hypothetical protein
LTSLIACARSIPIFNSFVSFLYLLRPEGQEIAWLLGTEKRRRYLGPQCLRKFLKHGELEASSFMSVSFPIAKQYLSQKHTFCYRTQGEVSKAVVFLWLLFQIFFSTNGRRSPAKY